MSHDVTIEITPGSAGSRVFIDGREIHQVIAVVVSASVDKASTVTLELLGVHVSVKGAVDDVTGLEDTATVDPPRFTWPFRWRQRRA